MSDRSRRAAGYPGAVPWLGFAALLGALLFALLSDKHLSADGVAYFIDTLQWGKFLQFDPTRAHAVFAHTWTLVLAARMNVDQLDLLLSTYSAGLLLPWLILPGLAVWALRGESPGALAAMLLGLVLVNLASDFILVGEHQVMALLCWPILFLMLRTAPLGVVECGILLILLVALTRSYPSAVAPAMIFAWLAWTRARQAPGKVRWVWVLSLVLCLLTVAIALYAGVSPRDPVNREQFLSSILAYATSSRSLATLAFLGLAGVAVFRCDWRWAALGSIPMLLLIAWTWRHGLAPTVEMSFLARTASATLLPLLLLAALLLRRRGICLDRKTAAAISFFVMICVADNMHGTLAWRDYRSAFVEVLEAREAYVPLAETGLSAHPAGIEWNVALLSLAWSGDCVETIVVPPPGLAWYPGAPPAVFPLERVLCYGENVLDAPGD